MGFKLVNPWRENLKDTPKESLNWRLWYGVFVFGKLFERVIMYRY